MKQIGALLLVALLTVQCRKEEKPVTPLPAGLKAYAYFQPGTYWIYQDSATGRLDSVWVTSARTYMHTTKDRNRIYGHNEEMEVHVADNASATEYIYASSCACPTNPDSSAFSSSSNDVVPCWYLDETRLQANSTRRNTVFRYSLPVEGPNPGSWAYRYRLPQRLSTGRTFAQVVTLAFMTTDGLISSAPTRYWWAKGLGVVQQRFYYRTGIQTRTLLRERIVQ